MYSQYFLATFWGGEPYHNYISNEGLSFQPFTASLNHKEQTSQGGMSDISKTNKNSSLTVLTYETPACTCSPRLHTIELV